MQRVVEYATTMAAAGTSGSGGRSLIQTAIGARRSFQRIGMPHEPTSRSATALKRIQIYRVRAERMRESAKDAPTAALRRDFELLAAAYDDVADRYAVLARVGKRNHEPSD